MTTRGRGAMGAYDARTQGVPIAALSGRLRTRQRACPARSGGPCSFCWRFLEERNDLAGVHDPVRVEELLDAAEERQQVAVLLLEIAQLAVADAVLAGARAAARERVLDDARVQRLGL